MRSACGVGGGCGRAVAARALRHQAAEHRVARVLGDALAAQEREEGRLEVARAPADDRRVERQHDRLAAARLGARRRGSRRARPRCSSRAGTSAGCRPAPRRTPPSGARPGWRRSSARRSRRAARATATSASRWASSSTPTGASRNGESRRRPNSSTRGVGPRDAAQHPRHDPVAGEGGAVLAHGVLRPGAGLDVGEGVGAHRLARGRLEALGVERDARAAPADALPR